MEFTLPAKVNVDNNKVNMWVENRKGGFCLKIKLIGEANNCKDLISESLTSILGSKISLTSNGLTEINFKSTPFLKKCNILEINKKIDEIKQTFYYEEDINNNDIVDHTLSTDLNFQTLSLDQNFNHLDDNTILLGLSE
ncbi:MAG: hypothetical protein LN588_04740 [Rickettsia endosymbiont of Bryobia graminum]|nr:hypothetical protein [Rickettsia endosymbiont of Bryobia graminum]